MRKEGLVVLGEQLAKPNDILISCFYFPILLFCDEAQR